MSSHHLSQRWQKAEMFYHAAAITYLHVLSFKEITQPVSRAEKASQSHIIPTVNTHLWTHHLAHTPKSVAFLCTTPCSSQTHLEQKQVHLFCHTSHHRMEMNCETQGGKNAWSNTQSWASGYYRKTCKCKRKEKRTCSPQKSLQPLICGV